MNIYHIVKISLLIIIVIAVVTPLISWVLMPGSTLHLGGYITFLAPAIMIVALFFVLPKISQTYFNVFALVGAVILLIGTFFYLSGEVSFGLYILGASGLYLFKRKSHFVNLKPSK